MNTELRTNAKKDFFKVTNNSVFELWRMLGTTETSNL